MHTTRRRLRPDPPRVLLVASLAALLAAAAPPQPARAKEDPLVAEGCDGCHRLEPPRPEERTVEALAARRGPDLFYAGTKYRPEWLRAWLQAPQPVRPAGLHPERHTRTVDGEDRLAAEDLLAHPTVSGARLDAVVEALLARTWGQEKLPAKTPRTPVPRPLAEMNFVKFKGCASCHRVAEDFGGVSGPELFTAWDRMRPEFLWSYIADPQAWDPVAPMPGYGLVPGEVGKLVEYLHMLSEERHDAE